MTRQELDKSIFMQKRPTKPDFKSDAPQFVSTELSSGQWKDDYPVGLPGEAVYFDIKGEITQNQIGCAAKKIIGKKSTTHFIKWCMAGPDKGHPLNPYSIYFRNGDDVRVEPRRGQLRYEFIKVSESAFVNYLTFLKSRIYIFCLNSEREVLNGG